ncbi:GATA zinc finger domain-containing protein 15-like [Schistocerca gregaria]|uniref:GATA zinc finger domain-containing protein 15-like n=1 Tax=Schistocerca gregaria TaxID=7010 RepID=UPI00211ED706|nr:GATA zinc finger domain-containing protein 15-like [Schistocerca gregaria]
MEDNREVEVNNESGRNVSGEQMNDNEAICTPINDDLNSDHKNIRLCSPFCGFESSASVLCALVQLMEGQKKTTDEHKISLDQKLDSTKKILDGHRNQISETKDSLEKCWVQLDSYYEIFQQQNQFWNNINIKTFSAEGNIHRVDEDNFENKLDLAWDRNERQDDSKNRSNRTFNDHFEHRDRRGDFRKEGEYLGNNSFRNDDRRDGERNNRQRPENRNFEPRSTPWGQGQGNNSNNYNRRNDPGN